MNATINSNQAGQLTLKASSRVRDIILLLVASCFLMSSAVRGESWPQFRGSSHQGLSAETQTPVHWSGTENIAWKTEIPGQSWSSPIVWAIVYSSPLLATVGSRVMCCRSNA